MANIPFSSSEQKRLKALKSYHILDTPSEDDFNNIVEIAALSCNMPMAYICLIDEDRQWLKANKGMSFSEYPRVMSVCQYTILDKEPLIIENVAEDKRSINVIPNEEGYPKFYAGFPLIDPDGYALGTLTILDTKPRTLTDDQKKILILLAQQTVTRIINRQKKQELRQLEKMFNLSTDLIRVCKKDGTILKMNPALKTILGWELYEVENTSLYSYLSPSSKEKTRQIFDQLSAENSVLNITYAAIAKDKSTKVLEWIGTYDPSTDLIYSIGRDITSIEEKAIELAKSEKKFRVLFESSPTFMCTHDLKGNFLSVNLAGAASIGYNLHELAGMSLFDIIPQDRHPFIHQYLEEIQKKEFLTAPMQVVTKNGEGKIWIFNNSLIRNENEEPYVIGNAVDITEMARLQEELSRTSNMLEQTNKIARIGGWELNLEDNSIYWSNITRLIHEVPNDYVPHLDNAIEFFKGEEGRRAIKSALELAINNKHPFDLILEIQTAKGNILWIRTIGTPIIDKNDKCIKLMGTFQDVDEKERNAEALRKAKLLAEQSSKAKSEFLANMSHEIRTPLNGVIGFTELVLKTNLNATQKKYISIVNESALTLLNIINDILDFSKLEAGKMEIINADFDLVDLASQAMNSISFQAENKNLQLSLNIGKDLPNFIYADYTRLKQILINLLGNAVKFTQAGKVELSISSIEELEYNTVKIHFEVTDTGIGIQADKQENIFKAFTQEDSSISKKYSGTGLGLAITNKLLKLMGSELHLKSEVGKGSTFYFDLAVKSKTEEPFDTEDTNDIKRVLLVDDSENNLTIIKEMLQLKNIETIVAKNGLEALQNLYSGETYDVILVDYFMPIMNGIETIRKIRENFYPGSEDQVIIVLYSSHEDELIERAYDELGINNRLMKPVKMKELYRVFDQLRNRKKLPNKTKDVERELEQISSKHSEKQITILIAEDNLINMFLTKTLIMRILPNALVYEANNGQEAVNMLNKLSPDLILMDVQMPTMDGLLATQTIRKKEENKNIPIIALTAGNIKGDKERCLDVGMNDFINKPVSEKALKEVLEKWIIN